MDRRLFTKLGWMTLFAIAMAYLEAAVVIYLRQLFWPTDLEFSPETLQPMPPFLATVEVGRETATIVMLVSLSILVGANRWERFAFFLWCFGLWDIFYYAWLYVLSGWPPSLLTADLLFLIPVPWFGPVLAPILVSVTMLGFALAILRAHELEGARRMWRYWVLALVGAWLIFSSFTVANYGPTANLWNNLLSGLLITILALWAVVSRQA